MSNALGVVTVARCIMEADKYSAFKGPVKYASNGHWLKDIVLELLESGTAQKELGALDAYVKGTARPTAEEINAYMEEVGSKVRLEPWDPNPLKFGVAGCLDVLVNWNVVGTDCTVMHRRKKYPGFRLPQSADVRILDHRGYKAPLVRIPTKQGFRMVLVAHDPIETENLWEAARALAAAADGRDSREACGFAGAEMPCVNMDVMPDISGFVDFAGGVNFRNAYDVVQAKQQVRFRMNKHGARVQEETAMECHTRGGPRMDPPYVLNEPFLAVLGSERLDMPLLMAYITPEDWKDPGDIAK